MLKVDAFYGFTVAHDGYVQMAIYFDDESDLETVQQIWRSVTRHDVPAPN